MCVTVSAPWVSLSVSVPSGPLVAGGVGDVTLTCSAMVDTAVVDTGNLVFSFTWLDRNNINVITGGRSSISFPSPSSTSLTLSPLSFIDTSFTCRVSVRESQRSLLESETGSNGTSINVQSKRAGIIDMLAD